MTIDEHKTALRRQARLLRQQCDPAAGEKLAHLVLRDVRPPPGSIVAGVWPMPGEMDLRPLLHALHDLGHPIVLPETPPLGQGLRFRAWYPGCPMIRETFGTFRTAGDYAAPDTVFVPLLAFDRTGGRLGYGGGYYDRTLAGLPDVSAIGFGYAAQEVAQVPMAEHDRRLPVIATETEIVFVTL